MTAPQFLVVSDLDDTLFVPHRLSIDAVTRRLLALLQRRQIPLVFASRRTRAEFAAFQREPGISQPFICENSAAVCIPRAYFPFAFAHDRDVDGHQVVEFGKPYAEIIATLRQVSVQQHIDIVALGEMSVEDVALECGVTIPEARLVKGREYSERFRIVDDRRGAVLRMIGAFDIAGLVCTSRGRYHWIGAHRYNTAGTCLLDVFRRAYGEVMTVAFCDHTTSAPLLQQADIPLVVPSTAGDQTTLLLARAPMAHLCVAKSIGDWAEIILRIAGVVGRSRNVCPS